MVIMKRETHFETPWQVDTNDDNGERVIRDAMGRIVANLECDRYSMADDEIEDNAHLMAAAPVMLEVLKKLYSVVNMDDDGDWFICKEAAPIMEELGAAISKAEGIFKPE